MRSPSIRRDFAAVVVAAAALRLLTFAALQMWTCEAPSGHCGLFHSWDDALQYHDIAKGLLASGTFVAAPGVYEFVPRQTGRQISAKRPPAYPLFLAALYSAFGERTWVVFYAQALLDALTCGLVLLLAARLTRHRQIALLAAALYAISPINIHYTQRLLSETLFTALFIAGLYAFSCARARHGSLGRFALCGALLGAAALTRPIGIFVPLVLAAIIAGSRASASGRERVLAAGTLLVSSALVMSVWMTRNRAEFGHFALSNAGDINLCWNAAALDREMAGFETFNARVQTCLGGRRGDWSESVDDPFAAANEARRRAMRYIRAHLGRYLYEHLRGMVYVHGAPEPSQWRTEERAWVRDTRLARALRAIEPALRLVLQPLLVVAAFVGLVVALRRRELREVGVFALVTCGYFVGLVGIIGLLGDTSRFMTPVMPLYCTCAAIAVLYIPRYLRDWLRRA
ncbi:MAG: glycosyltransferase family 39 protein [Myxococcales bacterium]|nr:glycosyltransferase family 39 protein [Myxococcales bacterium]